MSVSPQHMGLRACWSKYLKIHFYKATFWPIKHQHPPELPVHAAVHAAVCCSAVLEALSQCCSLGLVLDSSPLPQPQGFALFICLCYLWKGFSRSWQRGTGRDGSNKGGWIPLAAQLRPSPSCSCNSSDCLSCCSWSSKWGTLPVLPALGQPGSWEWGDGVGGEPCVSLLFPICSWDQTPGPNNMWPDPGGCLPTAPDSF